MAGRAHWECFKDEAGEWRLRLRAENGEIVATSESYTRAHDAETRGRTAIIDAVLQAGSNVKKVD